VGKHVIRVADLQVKGNLVEELQRLAHDEAARKEQERLYAEEDEHLEVMDEDADGVAEPMSAEELAAKGKIGKLSRIDAIIADDRGSSPISSSGSVRAAFFLLLFFMPLEKLTFFPLDSARRSMSRQRLPRPRPRPLHQRAKHSPPSLSSPLLLRHRRPVPLPSPLLLTSRKSRRRLSCPSRSALQAR